MVKHTQTIHRLSPTNCLSVFANFVGLALKGLNKPLYQINLILNTKVYYKCRGND